MRMKAIKYISDPQAFKLLADETRRKILALLRAKEMTVSKIAELLEVTPQTVYHHIRKLEDGGLVESTREERISTNLLEKYYRATAEVFHFGLGDARSHPKATRHLISLALQSMEKIGITVEYNDDAITKLASAQTKVDANPNVVKYTEIISRIDDVDLVTKGILERYAGLISMSEEEFTKFSNALKELWSALRSLLKKEGSQKANEPRPLSKD